MRKSRFFIFFLIIILIGCDNVSYTYEASVDYEAPNWTSDGKVVFIKDSNYVKIAHGAMGSEEWNVEGSKEVLTLCEINSDGTGFIEKGVVLRSEDYAYALDVTGLSSAGNWVTFGIEGLHIYVASRNGTSAEEVGEGSYPDFSPDASQIVYQKPNQGIWIMDRDGGNDHQIISEGGGAAWSPDGGRILYFFEGLLIADTLGNIIDSLGSTRWGADWGHIDSNSVIACDYSIDIGVLIHLASRVEDTLSFYSGAGFKVSPDGEQLTGYDTGGWFVINRNGTNKWYLNP
jgi:hypothetical protein